MMINGKNELVMKYLRSLPKDECDKTRASLIKNLEEIQRKKKASSKKSGGLKKESREEMLKVQDKVNSSGSVGRSSRTKKQRSRVSEEPLDCPIFDTDQTSKEMVGIYRIEEELGKGTLGVVSKGVNIQTGSIVAIKQIDLGSIDVARLNDVKVLESLTHENIVKIYDVIQSTEKHSIFLVNEFVEHGSLKKFIKSNGPLPQDIAAVMIRQCLGGLSYLHGNGVIHHNLKCDNLLINSSGIVKLADFGMPPQIGLPAVTEAMEMMNVGTLYDIWNLGCTVLEMLTGEPPPYCRIEENPEIPHELSQHPYLLEFLKGSLQKTGSLQYTASQLLHSNWIVKVKDSPIPSFVEVRSIVNNNKTEWEEYSRGSRSCDGQPNKIAKPSLSIPSNASLEDLQNILKDITQERDTLKAENIELLRQIQEVSSGLWKK
eukprot:TRINITY_DN1499_c0_g1_i1.p1 TRINITY_DN1499_c0_g1~~TRINITY_DN1499_c0_g1_i1.p1  ORF type:complete len:430 (-),score=93.93 TRINITY_DN1499_c0_g1_i1:167-1456(-)